MALHLPPAPGATPPSLATGGMLSLGSLVRHDGREAWVCAVSHDQPARYQVTYLDGALPLRRDHLEPCDIAVIDRHPADNDRAPPRLREWLKRGRAAVAA
jgi:hypothetical protein